MATKIWPRAVNALISTLSSLTKDKTGRLFWTGKERIPGNRKLFVEDAGELVEMMKVSDIKDHLSISIENDFLKLKFKGEILDSVSLKKYEEINESGQYTYGSR